MRIMQIVAEGKNSVYTFDIQRDGVLIATCDREDGGLNTCGADWNELVTNLDDCVATWESQ